ncbi:hypothetical protein [Sulfitobacter sp. R18_1]|uniref:hypothetical protein n=1 Tax=Sulfitobacter sp. R18_1 TaxID=2821104 RepID=UPI001ADB1FA4|nr:hypothetical protein [Sulfitobacter sp. R18_1]MBO9428479.1 hypothetical protein [Sulfitobacter sp. R18_1]
MNWTELSITIGDATLVSPIKSGLDWSQVNTIVSINSEDGELDRASATSSTGEVRYWTLKDGWNAKAPTLGDEVNTGLEGRRIAADPVKERMPGTDFLGYGLILTGVGEDYLCRFPMEHGGHLDAILTDKDIILLPDIIEMGVAGSDGLVVDHLDVTEAVLHSPVEDISSLRDGPADDNVARLHNNTALKAILSQIGSADIQIANSIADYFGISATVDLDGGQLMVSESDLKGLLEIYDQARVVHEFINSQTFDSKLTGP